MSFRVHIISLDGRAAVVNLSFEEDFSVVAGQTAAGGLVLPTCQDARYLVAGGFPGLRYTEQLGRVGGRFDFLFPEPVVAVLVATTSAQEPIPRLMYVAAVPVLLSVVGPLSQVHADPARPGSVVFDYYWSATWSAAGDQAPARVCFKNGSSEASPPPPLPGQTLAQLVAAGFTPIAS